MCVAVCLHDVRHDIHLQVNGNEKWLQKLPKRYSIMVRGNRKREAGRQGDKCRHALVNERLSLTELSVFQYRAHNCRMTLMNDLPPLISYYSA